MSGADRIPRVTETETLLSLWKGEITVRRGPSMVQIAQEVATEYGVTVEEMKGRQLGRWISVPRQIAMVRIRAETARSLPQIGAFFGRDHTTAWHAVQKPPTMADIDAWRKFGRPPSPLQGVEWGRPWAKS